MSVTVRNPMVPAVVRVCERKDETHDTFTLTLASPEGFSWRPGQFNMLYPFGVGEAAISIAGDPDDSGVLVHTIRAVGSVTKALSKLRRGDAVGVRGPFGSTWPLDACRGHDIVLVTGGIGIPPLRPLISHVFRHREAYGHLSLLHGCRSPRDLVYDDELQNWRDREDCNVHVTVDTGDASWTGNIGVVTTLFRRLELDPDRTIGMMCGPPIMMRFAIAEFEERGVGNENLYVSFERNMQCGIGFCGHCQLGPSFVCTEGPIFRFDKIKPFFEVREA